MKRRMRLLLAIPVVVAALLLTGCNDFFAAGWGDNRYSQLGTTELKSFNAPEPVDTNDVLRDKVVLQVDAGGWDSCSLASDGTAACWGAAPPLGTGLTEPILPSPFPMTGVFAGKALTKVAASTNYRCALTSDGIVGCYDRLGSTNVVKLGGALEGRRAVMLEVGTNQGCALTAEGVLACWPTVTPTGPGTPVAVNLTGVLAGQPIADLAKGSDFMCALSGVDLIACWGKNTSGQLGDGTTNDSAVPVEVVKNAAWLGQGVVDLGGGEGNHMCATLSEGGAVCWGRNDMGQLGNGTTVNSSEPVAVVSAGALVGKEIVRTATGAVHSCVVLDDASAACWGGSFFGQLGDGVTPIGVDPEQKSLIPVAVKALPAADGQPRPIVQLAAGSGHNMAVYEDLSPSLFKAMTPLRVLDTRLPGLGPVTDSITFNIAGVVPEGVTAVTYNLVATGQTASGAALLAPTNSPVSASQSSVINWMGPQQTIANGHVVRLGADRQLEISLLSTGSSHFVVDITGYFMPAAVPGGARFLTTDVRAYDSRDGDGKLAPGESRRVALPGAAMAAAASSAGAVEPLSGSTPVAAAVNVTATGTVGSGVLTVAKERSTTTSTVNWSGPNQTIANAVVTGLSEGAFTVTNNGQTPVDFVVDFNGLFLPDEIGLGAAFFPTDPARTYDSRNGDGALLAERVRTVTFPVPADAVAVAANTTVTGTSGTGFLTLNGQFTKTSTVNWFNSPTTRANGSFVPVNQTVNQSLVGGQFATHYLFDTSGFFR